MGLTLYYDWKTKSDLRSARRAIAKFHAIAQKLPNCGRSVATLRGLAFPMLPANFM